MGRLKVVVVSDQFILYIIKFYLQQLRYIGFLNFRGARGFFEGTYMGEEGGGIGRGHKTHVYTFQKTKQIIY